MIEKIREHLKLLGWHLLTTEYKNNKQKLDVVCNNRHTLMLSWNRIELEGVYCRKCFCDTMLLKVKEKAEQRLGKCLETEYISNKHKMLFECEKGHRWKAGWGDVLSKNSWCKVCSKHSSDVIETLQEYANSRGGKLISATYINGKTPVEWECEKGHHWTTCWEGVKKQESWCRKCAGKEKGTIEECQVNIYNIC
jgi:hypothetical protein